MKKLFALLLVAVVVFGLVACAPSAVTRPGGNNSNTTGGGTENQEVDLTPVVFPLETQQTLTLSIYTSDGIDEVKKQLEYNVLWQDILRKTNLKIDIKAYNMSNVASLFQTGAMGDLILCGGSGQDKVFANFAAQNLMLPLEAYINSKEIMPNLHQYYLNDSAEELASFTFPDGHIYIMGSKGAEKSRVVEGYMWINKTWLDQAKMDVPETFEELEAALYYFASHDMNGNGIDDEIPYYACQGDNMGIEYFMGMWGVSTKDGDYDNYVTVQDGIVQFVPQMEEWKTMLKKLREWDEAGILFEGCFTDGARRDLWNVAYGGAVRCGLLPANDIAQVRGSDQYVCMLPVAAIDGVEINWYINPGYMGSKNVFAVPKTSSNAKLACAFMDLFYDPVISARAYYGEEGNSLYRVENADGTFSPNYPTNAQKDAAKYTSKNTFNYITDHNMNAPSSGTPENYKPLAEEQRTRDAFAMYEAAGVITDEPWPRPYMDLADQRKFGELQADLYTLVDEKRAKWVTGVNDIDAEWDEFQDDLIAVGADEVVDILQDAYDYWLENYKGTK